MGGKSAPAAPDYTAAAEQQGASSRANTEQQTWANRPTVNTPWGQQTWEAAPVWDPTTEQYLNQWETNINLTPEQQASLDAQQRIQGARSGIAEDLLGNLQADATRGVDWGGLPAAPGQLDDTAQYRQNAEDALYRRAASRLDPMWQAREASQETKLWNSGFRPGDAGFDASMGQFGQQRNDAYQQAIDQAIAGGRAEAAGMQGLDIQGGQYQTQQRQQALAEQMQRSGYSLNQINAILSGQQVAMPQMPNVSQAGAAQATNYLGAAQMQGQSQLDAFNAEQAQLQGMLSGAGSLAAAAPFAFSDERLKTNVKRLDVEVIPGVPLATWEWKGGGHGFGVIADDVERVRPDLVVVHPNGYKMVNYEALMGGLA
jgi:hypothetical protein